MSNKEIVFDAVELVKVWAIWVNKLSLATCIWYEIASPSGSVETQVNATELSIHNKLFVGYVNVGAEGALFVGVGSGVSPPPPPPQDAKTIDNTMINKTFFIGYIFIF